MDDATNTMNWDYITKGMNTEELALANNTLKTRTITSFLIVKQLNRVQPLANNRYFKNTTLKAVAGKGDELEKMETMMKPVFAQACKDGAISGWRFGEILFPREGGNAVYFRGIATANMNDMLIQESSDYIAKAFKKVYPTKNYDLTMKAFRDIIEIGHTELYELIDSTKK